MPRVVEQFGIYVAERMKQQGWSSRAVARRAEKGGEGLSISTVQSAVMGIVPGPEKVAALAKALGEEPNRLLAIAGWPFRYEEPAICEGEPTERDHARLAAAEQRATAAEQELRRLRIELEDARKARNRIGVEVRRELLGAVKDAQRERNEALARGEVLAMALEEWVEWLGDRPDYTADDVALTTRLRKALATPGASALKVFQARRRAAIEEKE